MDGSELFKKVFVIVVFIINEAYSDRCITPNGEEAECISIYSCLKLTSGNFKEDKDAKEFVRRSYCGFDKDPLICCGSEIKSSKLLSYLRHSKFHIDFDDEDDGCNNCNTSANLNINNSRRRTSKTSKYLISGENSTKDCSSSAFLKLIRPRKNLESRASRKARSIKRKLKGSNYVDRRYCGKQRTKAVDEFPWLAHLRYSHRNKTDAGFKCVGALISERHLLTAARCIVSDNSTELELVSIQLGQQNKERIQNCIASTCNNTILDFGIEKLIPHPEYNVQKNDIGLIKLNTSVLFSGDNSE
ncbi:hypothetical protein ILUMI_23963 [Ignelater luminosus]|uniref:CLIP domain-containing serine protease n=1 Tax=Ignelater luminosus TaxID=2038154 RepID=A0A8K0FWQ8_IGNLU|nr:hypothetical protein ILUMI_23963 [Ignelater luminosus]